MNILRKLVTVLAVVNAESAESNDEPERSTPDRQELNLDPWRTVMCPPQTVPNTLWAQKLTDMRVDPVTGKQRCYCPRRNGYEIPSYIRRDYNGYA